MVIDFDTMLLNDKSDDDDLESKAGVKNKSELLQQLLKPERDINEDKKNDLQSQDDTLLRSLGFPPTSPTGDRGRKRPNDDKDDSAPNKRSSDGSQVSSSGPSTGSKLWERNKMLASLLAKQPTNHQPIPPLPADEISAIPQEKLPRITDPNKTLQMNAMNQNMMQNMPNNARTASARMPGRPQNSNYLNTILSGNAMHRIENRQMSQMNSGCYTSPATSSTDNNTAGWDNMQSSNDPLLSDILDQVIDIVPDDDIMHLLDGSDGQQSNNFQTGLSETMAINIIQKSLMQCESDVKIPVSSMSLAGTPPAYSSPNIANQNNQTGVFPPPPNYSQSKFTQRMQARPGASQYAGNITSQLLLQQQRKQLLHQQQQQEQKRRLLQQQKQQQLLIPSNAAANEMNSMQNIDSLLNNTVAPNVSLQRSASVPEPQLSPGYGGQRVGGQQPYSPHSQLTSPQTFPQTTAGNYQNPGARLSPQAQFNSQLSPRQAYPQASAPSANWQQTQARLSVQQNPMLSAQLTGNFISGGPNGRNFQRPPQQQQRTMNSPGTVPTRHSPYPADQFPPPTSPNSAFNSQYLRLQRANSAPNATTQLPGGLGSPRPYTGREHHPHPYPTIPPHHNVPPMMYQQDSQYCYDQTGIPLAYNGADRGRAPPHLQSGVSGSGPTSEFVRQELRAVVGARTGQTQPTSRPQSQLLTQQQQVSDLETLGINFEMATGASDSPKLWGAMGSDMGSMSPQPATSRSSMEEGRQGDQKSSLLQKLLSE